MRTEDVTPAGVFTTRTIDALVVAVAVATIALFAIPASAGAAGTWTNLGAFSGSVSSVQALDYNTVIVGGSYTPANPSSTNFPSGRVYRSTNGGTSFSSAALTTCFSVSNIAFVDATHGWATGIGFDAESYSTVDGGVTWRSMGAFARRATKKAIAFADASNGWAVGQQGVTERTRDGGRTWEMQVEPVAGPELMAVDAVDATHVWAVGGIPMSGAGFIRHSSNGGATWVVQKSGLPSALTGVAFADRTHGVAVGQNGTLLVTKNGGATWTQASLPRASALGRAFAGHINGVAWANGTRVFAAGYGGALFASPDRGVTWTDESDPAITADFTSIGAAGGSRVWVTAGTRLYRFTYTPPPTKWTKRVSGTTAGLFDVDFVDATHGWAVGGGGLVLKTTDGAKTWKRVGAGATSATLTGVDFVDRSTGWAVGRFPVATPLAPTVILRTDDGGATWKPQAHPNDGTFIRRVRMTSKTDGWILGEHWRVGQAVPPKPYFSILRTTDGGSTWTAHRDSPPDLLSDAVFPTPSIGFIAGYRGSNFKTVDGGATWTRLSGVTGVGRGLGVAFTSPTNGIIAGDRVVDTTSPGMIAHTADGGATWSGAVLPTTAQLRSATSFKGSIWVVGEKGTILRSGDGGSSWGVQSSGTTMTLHGVKALSNDFIVAVGSGGTILTGARTGATLSKPKLGFPAKRNAFLQITGTVTPAVADSNTKVVVYRKVGRAWKVHKTVTAKNFVNAPRSGPRRSVYYANTKAGPAGTYSAVATFTHPDYKTSSSTRFTFIVK
ncbi:MAG: YCF48-related protein [Coriobacteriia bacterium]|nr:YCF48-related protein [Coriobacteriia bacterium]